MKQSFTKYNKMVKNSLARQCRVAFLVIDDKWITMVLHVILPDL